MLKPECLLQAKDSTMLPPVCNMATFGASQHMHSIHAGMAVAVAMQVQLTSVGVAIHGQAVQLYHK